MYAAASSYSSSTIPFPTIKMERNFFRNLPSEITTEILSRLPLRNLTTDDFEFKTPPAFALFQQMNSIRCSIFEIEDEDKADEEKSHDLHYIELWCPQVYILDDDDDDVYVVFSIGFGISKISGQYKVVCINVDTDSHYVYTLGIGTWRRVEAGAASGLRIYSAGHIVCNDNIHWIGVYHSANTLRICASDLENECFSAFSPPPPPPVEGRSHLAGELSALRDCLSYSYTWEDEIVIWWMKEYRVEESWTVLYKISNNGFDFDRASGIGWNYMCVKLIKLFKDGDVLMLLEKKQLIYHSNKTRTIQQVGMFKDAAAKDYDTVSAVIFTPSLFSLKNFGFENVISF